MKMWEFLSDGNQLHTIFKKFEADHPNKFKLTGINRCGHCNGTGLKSQNLELACTECVGVGYVGFKELNEESICPDCNSTGKKLEMNNHVSDCKTCDGCGKLDWVDAVIKGIDLEKIW
jgi:DnaJ-class molecular chaperone